MGEEFPEHFPTVFQLCQEHGLDPRTQPIPVAPAAHYHMGGIAVDDDGRTSLPGLWACGEVTATGVHGANRLASNSLLEALVFGARVADDLRSSASGAGRPRAAGWPAAPASDVAAPGDAELIAAVRRLMWEKVGLVRDEAGLTAAVAELRRARRGPSAGGGGGAEPPRGRPGWSTAAALERRESRGGHYRSDFPASDPAWQRRLFLTAAPDGSARFEAAEACRRLARGREPCVVSEARSAVRLPPLYPILYEPLVRRALEEDLGRAGDLTSDAILPPDLKAEAEVVARAAGRIAGLAAALSAFRLLDPSIGIETRAADGQDVEAGTVLATVHGPARSILSAERTALNLLGRLCGIATATRDMQALVAPHGAHIVCTRKTTPGLRALEKYAVRCGGGQQPPLRPGRRRPDQGQPRRAGRRHPSRRSSAPAAPSATW